MRHNLVGMDGGREAWGCGIPLWLQGLKAKIQEGIGEKKKVAKYIVKRIVLAIVSIFIVSAITFFVMNAIPGGPFNNEKATSAFCAAAPAVPTLTPTPRNLHSGWQTHCAN